MNIDFEKGSGLVPAIIQDSTNLQVLMLGYMNKESFKKTQETKKVYFYSRSRKRLWMKGESSENILMVDDIFFDCDLDTILIKAIPTGPVCHNGDLSCFKNDSPHGFIYLLEKIINERSKSHNNEKSYTKFLLESGTKKIAQKIGEEATELILEIDGSKELLMNEFADLMFHMLVLLKSKDISLQSIEEVLLKRSKEKKS